MKDNFAMKDNLVRPLPEDQQDRDIATTTFDQNIVVTAGAGTGKTTLLVNRLIHLLMREPDPVQVYQIVALTFTNKSANEMRVRLRDRLSGFISSDKKSEDVSPLMDRYGLSEREIIDRAKDAIRHLNRAEIGTIHHFSSSLLRLYPNEAGVDPRFRVDEGGERSKCLFEVHWADWLETELGHESPRKSLWLTVLGQNALSEVQTLAKALVFNPIPLDTLSANEDGKTLLPDIKDWLKSLLNRTEDLISRHAASRKIEQMLSASETIFREVLKNGAVREGVSEPEQTLIATGKPGKVKGWEADEFKVAENLIHIAKQLLQVNPMLIRNLMALLTPFLSLLQGECYRQGLISFDALLIKARNLLRDHPRIREALKERYHAILIDEFQDVDPVQYEVLLYLSEQTGTAHHPPAKNWKEIKLSHGKLFVVGDPKQSIYGFRQADIAAYHTVRRMIVDQGGIDCTLRTNFRSHKKILDLVNGLCGRIIQEKKGIQAEYIPINPANFNKSTPGEKQDPFPFRQVSLRCVKTDQEDLNAEQNRRLEGEAIADWLSEDVLGKALILDRDGQARTVQKGDIAILMRSLSGIHHVLEALRCSGIDYCVEGERHFYRSQTVMDAVNLLRAVADPADRLALVGLLRSPVGGLTDRKIYHLHQAGLLDYRDWSRRGLELDPIVRGLYASLSRLHDEVFKLPVGEAISRIFEQTPIRVLSAAATNGEQAIANLEKIQVLAEQLSGEEGMSLREVIAVLGRRVSEDKEEGESPLAEEGVDAIRVFSIHKAKGLEFPVVILAGCHAGTSRKGGESTIIRHDWSTNLSGLKVGEIRNLASVFLAEKERQREIEEEKRILYVALTRAREHLMISAAPKDRIQNGSILSYFQEVAGPEMLNVSHGVDSEELPVGEGLISRTILSNVQTPGHLQADKKSTFPPIDWTGSTEAWEKRTKNYQKILQQPVFLTPTLLKKRDEAPFDPIQFQGKQHSSGKMAALIGQVAHRFLEKWDFSSEVKHFRDKLSRFLENECISEDRMDQEAIYRELEEIFQVFFHAPPYQEICQAKIVGREIPFLIPWDGQVMEGVIDLLYEKSGDLYIGEYKTDRVNKETFSKTIEKYRHQRRIYPEAVRRTLKRNVAGMNLFFLRIGEACFEAGQR